MGILAVGSIAYDTIKTPYGRVEHILGGSLTHFCAAATHFTPVNIVGIVGSDFDFKKYDFLVKRGVNTSGLEVVDGGETFCWEGEYTDDMNEARTISTCINVFEKFSPKIDEKFKKSKFVFLGNIDPDLQLRVLEQMEKPRIRALDTMNLWINSKLDLLKKAISKVDVLIVNDKEALSITRAKNIITASKSLVDMGPRVIVIKRGCNGACLRFGEKLFLVPAYPLEKVIDPTGAGDSFAGGFLGYLSKCRVVNFQNLKKALIHGIVVSSFNVEKFGVDGLKHASISDINTRYKRFLNIIKV